VGMVLNEVIDRFPLWWAASGLPAAGCHCSFRNFFWFLNKRWVY
jgi:hypothetical protein